MLRDGVQTDDDVAIQAAKEKLAALAERPGFEEAMVTRPSGSTAARWVTFGVALLFGGLAFASCTQVEATWLRVVLVPLFIAMTIFGLFAGIGAGPEPAPEAFGAVITGKEQKDRLHHVQFLRSDGTSHDVLIVESLFELLRVGDVGVAHVKAKPPAIMVEFHRL